MSAYYNEHDPFAAAWLRELIKAGHIADGEVDERSIEDVLPIELAGFTQCHFFAGIGGWSLALRLAGWPDDRPVWTGSCPCQPFSAAGKGKGHVDERHLWPAFFYLIDQRRPDVVFGEQVEAAIKHGWLDLVQADMEGIGYAFAAVGLPAACVGAFQIRARAWFVANAGREQWSWWPNEQRPAGTHKAKRHEEATDHQRSSTNGELAYASGGKRETRRGGYCREAGEKRENRINADGRGVVELGYPVGEGLERHSWNGDSSQESGRDHKDKDRPAPETSTVDGFWSDADWLPCADGKARPVEPGTFPLAHGVSGRVGRLRGYGNAIVPQVAQAFIESYLEAIA